MWPFRATVTEPAGKSCMKELQNEGVWNLYKPPAKKKHEHLKRLQYWQVWTFFWPVVQSCLFRKMIISDEYLSHNLQHLCSSFHTQLLAIILYWAALHQKVWRTTVFLCDFTTISFLFWQHLYFLACIPQYCFIRNQPSIQSFPAACHEVIHLGFFCFRWSESLPPQGLEPHVIYWYENWDG